MGGAGEVYALDIDPLTGLFMRWRPSIQQMEAMIPINPATFRGPDDPESPTSVVYPSPSYAPIATVDQILPVDKVFTDAYSTQTVTVAAPATGYARVDLVNAMVLARRVHLLGSDDPITGMTVTGGPTQVRNNNNSEFGTLSGMTVEPPPYPAGLTGSTIPQPPSPFVPTVPQGVALAYQSTTTLAARPVPTNDVPNLRPFDLDATMPDHFDPNGLDNLLISMGHITNLVNQDIDDSLTTTRGTIASLPYPLRDLTAESFVADTSYQYPTLICSTLGNYLHAISTNIEGEDYLNNNVYAETPANAISSEPIGWGFAAPGNYAAL